MDGHLYKNVKMSSTKLMQLLMDEKILLKDLVDVLDNMFNCENKVKQKNQSLHSNPTDSRSTIPINVLELSDVASVQMVWSSNLEKCIDGSPLVDSGQVYANSHAGIFRCFECASGTLLMDYKAESCALEATCSISPNFVALGGLNGDLHVFDRKSHSLYEILKTNGEIRMTPVFDFDETFFYGSYDGYLYMRNFEKNTNGRFDVSATQDRGAMRSSPLVTSHRIIVATLGGHVLAFEKFTNKAHWCKKVDGPVFANVVQMHGTSLCCVVTVQGHVNLFSLADGKKHSELELSETIFDAPVPFQQSYFLFTGGNGVIFLLEFAAQLVLLKRFQLAETKIVRGPIVLGDFVFVITVQGVLYRIMASSIMEECLFLPCTTVVDLQEETFGSPAIQQISYKQYRVIIGSRKDLLRCFLVEYK